MDPNELRQDLQLQLVEFLRTDLELARIFVESARRQLKMGEFENYGRLLGEATKAITTLHYFGEKEIVDAGQFPILKGKLRSKGNSKRLKNSSSWN